MLIFFFIVISYCSANLYFFYKVSSIFNFGTAADTLTGLVVFIMTLLPVLIPFCSHKASEISMRVISYAGYMWLAVIGVATSLISAFYYLRVIRVMWMSGGESQAVLPIPLRAVVGVTAVATVVLGLLPAPLMDVASRALLSLFSA